MYGGEQGSRVWVNSSKCATPCWSGGSILGFGKLCVLLCRIIGSLLIKALSMEYNREAEGILQRIDKMADDLQRLRREVAQLLVKHTELCAESGAKKVVEEEPTTGERSGISCISSLEELYARDFESDDEPTESAPIAFEPMTEPMAKTTEEPTVAPVKSEGKKGDSLDELFVTAGGEEAMEELFEVRKGFDLLPNLTIADRYLYANELFYGNQAELDEMLADIERLSDIAHVESYLYDVRKLSKDEEVVQHLLEFIKEHRCK